MIFGGPRWNFLFLLIKQKQRDALNAELKVKKEELATLDKEAKRKYQEWTQQQLRETQVKESEWQVLTPTKAVSDGGETLRIVKDGSLLAEGKSGDKSTYHIEVSVPRGPGNHFKWKPCSISR